MSLHPYTLALSCLSPSGARARLTTLIYHRVLAQPDPLQPDIPDVTAFRWQMALLARHFNVLPLAEAARRLREGTLPARAACITFDDGYADNLSQAQPILQSFGLPATFFIATGYLDGGRMFNDTLIEYVRSLPDGTHDFAAQGLGHVTINDPHSRRSLIQQLIRQFKYLPAAQRATAAEALAQHSNVALPRDLMLTRAELRSLHAAPGVTIGAHTHTHPILTQLDDDSAAADITRGRHELEALLDSPITVFAYPNGRPGKDYDERHVAMVRQCGFACAVSTAPAAGHRNSDVYQLPRFTPWDTTPKQFALRLLRTLAHRH
jgi:peptidoglycan/xylan/chitin deacetylase (PgdA/CDA1 family)